MIGLDHVLLHQARTLTTGANVHAVKTWILCYENSVPDSKRRVYYEHLLREFVASQSKILAARAHAELARGHSIEACAASAALERKIEEIKSPR